MITVRIDREPIELASDGMTELGELWRALEPRMRGRVVVSAVLNGWERVDPTAEETGRVPLELVTDIWIETEAIEQAMHRALESASALAVHAASTASRAGEAFEGGRDAEGYLGFGDLCGYADSLASLAETLPVFGAANDEAKRFLDTWRARCVPALAGLVEAGEEKDVTLLADHLLYDVAPAFEALGAQECAA